MKDKVKSMIGNDSHDADAGLLAIGCVWRYNNVNVIMYNSEV